MQKTLYTKNIQSSLYKKHTKILYKKPYTNIYMQNTLYKKDFYIKENNIPKITSLKITYTKTP